MAKVHCLNKISKVGLAHFNDRYEFTDKAEEAEAILVRSASMHDMEMPENLLAIARAGAGVNNIPLESCAEKGIVVFNTPGANANGVKELVIAGLMLASRDIVGGAEWVQSVKEDEAVSKLVEKNKSQFAGCEIQGKKLGVIGLGAIGVLVANAATHLGMEVYGCDPYISIEHAWHLSRNVYQAKTREEIFKECDYITVHVPLLDDTREMINKETIAMMKDGVVILNFARDLLVNDDDMAEALKTGKVKKYVTDFPNAKTANMEGCLAIPHLGASTEESEDNCAAMAVQELKNYIENGNIVNSVNFPNCDAGLCETDARMTILHRNVPNMLSQFTTVLGTLDLNIEHMTNKSKGAYAYSVFDYTKTGSISSKEIKEKMEAIDNVLKVRIIK